MWCCILTKDAITIILLAWDVTNLVNSYLKVQINIYFYLIFTILYVFLSSLKVKVKILMAIQEAKFFVTCHVQGSKWWPVFMFSLVRLVFFSSFHCEPWCHTKIANSPFLCESNSILFSLTWPASMEIYWNRRNRLHKKRVQLPQD